MCVVLSVSCTSCVFVSVVQQGFSWEAMSCPLTSRLIGVRTGRGGDLKLSRRGGWVPHLKGGR